MSSLTVVCWPAYRFLRRQVRCSGIPISLRIFQSVMIHTVKGFGTVNKAEIDIFLEFSCFLNDPTDVGNLISGSFAFSKSSLNIWKFSVHTLLKPGLENFEHYFTSMLDECSCAVVWTFFGIAFFGIGMKTDFFQSCDHGWVFQICWLTECSTLRASSFRILNSSTGVQTQLTWISAYSRRQWRTGKPGLLQFMGLQRVRHYLATEQHQTTTFGCSNAS